MRFKTCLFLMFFILASCGKSEWQITNNGLIDVFPENLQTIDGKFVNAEVSAIVYDGQNIFLGNDKKIPGDKTMNRSPVFSMNYQELEKNEIHYIVDSTLIKAQKYEDFTITFDGEYIFATTGFDRVKDDESGEWDNYNTLLCWKVGEISQVKIISPSTRNGLISSVGLREKISTQLKTKEFPAGVPYFKIEGLAALPDNRLLFGVREFGASYKDFRYAIKIISVTYEIEDETVVLNDDFQLIYDFDASEFADKLNYETVALSSIEFNKYDNCIYLLTNYEKEISGEITDESLGAFIWKLSLNDLELQKAPQLLKYKNKPIHFAHKAEGISIIDESTLMVVHDDDRVLGRKNITNPDTQFFRKRNQCAYTILEK